MTKFERLDKLHSEGLLRRVVSECGDLILYNYTDKCTFDRKWNKDTLSARGTVYELETGTVVAKAFDKFFNFGELPKSKSRNLAKKKDFETYEKMDGSLGIIYNYGHKGWCVNTRGSFTSDQAIHGREMLQNMMFKKEGYKGQPELPYYDTSVMNEDYTYLVEIIYPNNKIIVNYGQEHKLVLLAMIHTESGEEIPYDMMVEHAKTIGMPVAKQYKFNNIDELIAKQHEMGFDEEGFVVKIAGERVKFKSIEYLKVASAMSHMTPIHFWKNMKNADFTDEFLSKFPEEIKNDVDDIVKKLKHNYGTVNASIQMEIEKIKKTVCPIIVNDKKALCKYIGQHLNNYRHPNALFAIINNKKHALDGYIMKQIRPNGNQL